MENEAIKKIIVEVLDNEYTLEYNRKAVERMEERGFNMGKIEEKIVTSVNLMVEGGLYKNHRNLVGQKLDDVVEAITNEYDLNELLPLLTEMIAASVPDFGNESGVPKKDFKIVR